MPYPYEPWNFFYDFFSSPAIADINGDGDSEIILSTASANGNVYAWQGDGSLMPGWPQSAGTYNKGGAYLSSPVVGDLDGDSDMEIVVGGVDGSIYAWHHDGIPVSGWPVFLGPNRNSLSSSPTLVNIDGDLALETAIRFRDQLYLVNDDGTLLAGWPKILGAYGESSPVIGDINGDGEVDIVVTNFQSFELVPGKVLAFHTDGSTVSGWPRNLRFGSDAAPLLDDIDADGLVEMAVQEIFIPKRSSNDIFIWNLAAPYQEQNFPWRMFRHDIYNSGWYNFKPQGCGNRIIEGGEQCDDGDILNGDDCTSLCMLPSCGDGVLHRFEECDDGNRNLGDGCSLSCKEEICIGIQSKIVSWWPGEGEADDIWGVNDGIVSGTTFVLGKTGKAFHFDDAGDSVDLGNDASLDIAGNEFSFSGWFRWTEPTGSRRSIFQIGGFPFKYFLSTGFDDQGYVEFGVGDTRFIKLIYTAGSNLDDGEWHFIVGTRKGEGSLSYPLDYVNNLALYIDGVKQSYVGSGSQETDLLNALNGRGTFLGDIDEFVIYNHFLSEREIKSIYETNQVKCVLCGDGFVDAEEECDDGNPWWGDNCLPTCKLNVCGDRHPDSNGVDNILGNADGLWGTADDFIGLADDQQCDDGGTVSGDGCDATCKIEVCGNNILQNWAYPVVSGTAGPETCDDGNLMNNDGCSATCKPQCTVPSNILISWWPAEHNGNDLQSNQVGTLFKAVSGSKFSFRTGKIGSSFGFSDVAGDYIDVPMSDKLRITGPLTVMAWVAPTEAPTGVGRVVASTYKYGCSTCAKTGWTLGDPYGSGDAFGFEIWDGSGYDQNVNMAAAGVSGFFNNIITLRKEWTLVTGVFMPGQYVRLYVDGVLVAEDTTNIPLRIAYDSSASPVPLRIGQRADSENQGMWDGRIDEVQIYAEALTPEQIKGIFIADTYGLCKNIKELCSDGNDNDADGKQDCLDMECQDPNVIDQCYVKPLLVNCVETSINTGIFSPDVCN